MNMFLEITAAEYLEDYKVILHFCNGENRIIDLYPLLEGEVFEPLKDKQYFKNFTIKFNTIEWENGADFAPEYLYEHSVPTYVAPNDSDGGMVAEDFK